MKADPARYVIIGNGAAGVAAAEAIRKSDPAGLIAIVGDEPHPMYSRPGLVFALLHRLPLHQLIARQPAWYKQHQIRLIVGSARRLDTRARQVHLSEGRYLRYDRLLLATGAAALCPDIPGLDLDGVVYLDNLRDVKVLRRQLQSRRRAAIIGSGITALEMAEAAAHHGLETHLFVRRQRFWRAALGNAENRLFLERMTAAGIKVHFNSVCVGIEGDRRGRVRAIRLQDGREFRCRVAGVAVGVRPRIDMIAGSPVLTDRAICVDNHLRTNVPDVFAAGDCAQVYDEETQSYLAGGLWHTAVEQGRVAGLNMAGEPVAYERGCPFNTCELFGVHMAIIGEVGRVARSLAASDGEMTELRFISRGSPSIWYKGHQTHTSAWSKDGLNFVRLILNERRLVGAVLMGEQSLADPLRYLIEQRVDLQEVLAGGRYSYEHLARGIAQFWSSLAVA